jgi:hypothetical protein
MAENSGTDKTINIHHIGGLWDIGEVEKLMSYPYKLFIYDANQDNLTNTKNYPNTEYINKCIGDGSEVTFYEFKNSSANSIYPSEPRAKEFIWKDGLIDSWGKWCTVVNTSKIKTERLTGQIDVLSMDAQASEWNIMQGISNWDDILLVITEVEFQPLYKGQKLFGDMFNFLISKGFRLMDMGQISLFNDNAEDGDGFCTHAEPIFIKDYIHVKNKDKLEKLAKIAECFNRTDFARRCRERVVDR